LLEILILTSFFSWFFWELYLVRSGKDTFSNLLDRLKSPLDLPLIIFLIVATLALFATPDIRGGLGFWRAYFVEGSLVYVVVTDISVRQQSFIWALQGILISGALVSIFSILNFISLAVHLGLAGLIDTRVPSVYAFANAVPLYLGPIIGLAIGLAFYKSNEQKKKELFYLSIVSLILMIIAVLLSQSKGGIVGIFSVLVVWVGYLTYKSLSNRFKVYFKRATVLLVIFYFLASLLVFLNINGLVPEKRFPSNSLLNRYCIWQGARNIISDHPLTGTGLGGFSVYYEKYQKTEAKTCPKSNYFYPHNILLTFWSELGALGLLAFLWLSFNYIKINSEGKNKLLSVGFLAALVYIFIHGLVDVPFFKNDLSVQFWLLASFVTLNSKVKEV